MSLDHYRAVRDGQRPPRFHLSRRQPVADNRNAWQRHAHALATLDFSDWTTAAAPAAHGSLLDLKVALATTMYDACDLCPHHCLINRNAGKVGYCGVASDMAVHWEGILHGEEIELVPSHEVFLSGWTMRCAFCYSHEHITHAMSGRRVSPGELANRASARYQQGATNLNLVGASPRCTC